MYVPGTPATWLKPAPLRLRASQVNFVVHPCPQVPESGLGTVSTLVGIGAGLVAIVSFFKEN